MKNDKKPFQKGKAIKLFLKGVSQKEIAIQLGVTEKTVYTWLKEIKEKYDKNQQDIKALGVRIRNLIETPNSDTNDIRNLAISIERLENIWYKELIKI